MRPKVISVQLRKLSRSVDQRFAQVDQRFAQVDRRLEEADRRFDELRQLILSEGERTRQHFDVVAEQMKSERNVAIDKSIATDEHFAHLRIANASAHARFEARLDDHERRLTALESGSALGDSPSG
jgi:hypothetical protein